MTMSESNTNIISKIDRKYDKVKTALGDKASMAEDIKVIVARIECKLDAIHCGLGNLQKIFEGHAAEDKQEFKNIRSEIGALYKYAASVGMVSAGLGSLLTHWWGKITGSGG